jgi:hypothetical protein
MLARWISTLSIFALLAGIRVPLDVLVDADHPLPAEYDPGLYAPAQHAMEALIDSASQDGVEIVVLNGYRPYEVQADLYARDPSNRAPPGQSEHQLGTTFDLAWPGRRVHYIGQNEVVWSWLERNAHRFGFVISYPYKECDQWPYNNNFMGACGVEYRYEAWHVRYVGQELAEEIHAAGYLDPGSSVLPQDFYRVLPAWMEIRFERMRSGELTIGDRPLPYRRWPRGRIVPWK